jgi:hypothetical protein
LTEAADLTYGLKHQKALKNDNGSKITRGWKITMKAQPQSTNRALWAQTLIRLKNISGLDHY